MEDDAPEITPMRDYNASLNIIRETLNELYVTHQLPFNFARLVKWFDRYPNACKIYEPCLKSELAKTLTAEDAARCNLCAELLGEEKRFRSSKTSKM